MFEELKKILVKPLSRNAIYLFLGLYSFVGCSILMKVPDIFNHRNEVVSGLPTLVNKLEYPQYSNNVSTVRLDAGQGFICSGVVVSQIYVVTAAHCVDKLRQSFAIDDSAQKQQFYGEVVGIYDEQDIALIKTDIKDGIRPVMADFDGTQSTERVVPILACGFPKGQTNLLCTEGALTGNRFFLRRGSGILYTGMSGGPVYKNNPPKYTLIGVNSAVEANAILVGPLTSLSDIFFIKVVQ